MKRKKRKPGPNSKSQKRIEVCNEEYKVYKTPKLLSATNYYNDSSVRIPQFYSRPGPGTYQQDQGERTDYVLQNLSKHKQQMGQTFGKEDFPSGFYLDLVPKHRFLENSKSQVNSAILL